MKDKDLAHLDCLPLLPYPIFEYMIFILLLCTFIILNNTSPSLLDSVSWLLILKATGVDMYIAFLSSIRKLRFKVK